MLRLSIIAAACIAILPGCGIPPVDTSTVSRMPANAQSFAVAQRAARACSHASSPTTVSQAMRRAGFAVSQERVTVRGGRQVTRFRITSPDDAVRILYFPGSCYVGLEGMTPAQSSQLASIWVEAHQLLSNAEFGDGLSSHVSGAWRRFFTEPPRFPDKAPYAHRIYVAAYKTWPSGPYDPQRSLAYDIGDFFPKTPGAAVRLNHAIECKPQVTTGPRSGVFLPCSGPTYRPR
ncbi:hypothetical protein SAMN05443551_3542 [Marivita hallyeonensis]|uniref:Uncharacterized protein n=1 Tax=Marivita hallyeonensis TaxID=996342 RepID=A0A1M5WVJ3_9RHOB|nr:hypothetical protein SAMN05443551_3542 [Marivita hallyeonensis]